MSAAKGHPKGVAGSRTADRPHCVRLPCIPGGLRLVATIVPRPEKPDDVAFVEVDLQDLVHGTSQVVGAGEVGGRAGDSEAT